MARFLRLNVSIVFFALLVFGIQTTWAQQGGGKIVRSLKIQGNQRIASSNILYYVKTKVGDPLSLAQIRRDIEQIFSLGQFKDIQVDTNDLSDGVEVIFIVVEIPSIGDVRLVGNGSIEATEIRKNISLKRGATYKEHSVKDAIDKITGMYHEKGYFFANVKIDTDKSKSGSVNVLIRIKEGQKVDIKEIRFRGNRSLKAKALRGVMQTKQKTLISFLDESGIYKKDVLKLDLLRLEAFYQDNGFYRVRVLDPKIDVNKKEKRIYITIPIEEGIQYKVNSITAKGDDTWTEEEILSVMQLKKGDIFDVSKFREDVLQVTEIYSIKGFAYADVNPKTKVDDKNGTVDLEMEVNRGSKVYVGEINVIGNNVTRDNVIRREFRMKEGELYNSAKLNRSKSRLSNLGFFEDVKLDTRRGSEPDLIDIDTVVTERPTGSLSIGAGFSSVENLIFNASISKDNLFGRAQKLQFTTQLSSTRLDFNLSFTDPRIFDSQISAGFDVFRQDSTFFSFDSSNSGGGLRLGKALGEYDWAGINYRFERVEISGVNNSDATEFLRNETRTTSRITPTYVWDSRDNFLNPTRGWRHRVSFDFAGGPLGGSDFVKMNYDVSYQRKVIGKLVAMARMRGAYGQGYNGDSLPSFERYFLGGASNLRGFTIRNIGPQNGNTDPLGGNQSLLFNLELQYALTREFRVFTFYDRGNIWDSGPGEGGGMYMDLGDMRHSIGAGLRFISPFGPIGIAYGLKLDQKTGETTGEFHFSAGG
ncbi:MAG: outer membrane protein assembly factor BamA [Nitrospinales bacterium]